MIKYIFIILSLLPVLLSGQARDYDFVVTMNPDSTYDLSIIEEISNDRQLIQLYKNLTQVEIQSRLYAEINSTWQVAARREREIDYETRRRGAVTQALNSVGLNNYYADKIVELDSFYVASSWSYGNSQGDREELTTLYRKGLTTVLRDSSNTNFGAIVPRSQNSVLINFIRDSFPTTQIHSNNGTIYVGEDSGGVRHVFIKRN